LALGDNLMLQAQLRGKLTKDEEGMEDLLTSNVFGAISYSAPEDGLIPFMAGLEDEDGKQISLIQKLAKLDIMPARPVHFHLLKSIITEVFFCINKTLFWVAKICRYVNEIRICVLLFRKVK